jgi:glycosyltransferase involved in cell wall biosynthesis
MVWPPSARDPRAPQGEPGRIARAYPNRILRAEVCEVCMSTLCPLDGKHKHVALRMVAHQVKVVRIIARLNVGGPALHCMHLTAGLADRYPTLLVTGQVDASEADMTALARGRGLRVHIIPELGREIHFWDDAVVFVKLFRLLRKIRPTIVHTHTAKAGTVGRLAALAARVPIRVHTFHGHVFRGYFGPRVTRLFLWIERLLARGTTQIIAVSPSQAAELADVFRVCERKRIHVVPLGLDLEPLGPARIASLRDDFRRELGVSDEPVIVCVGRLVPIKNHQLFLRMAAELTARGRCCMYVIVGGGPEEERLRARTKELGLTQRVRFLGWRSDLERIYAGADIVTLTSNNEGTPVCLIEALAAGRAVVATDVGGVRDVLGDGSLGVLVPPGNAAALAGAVITLLDQPALRADLGRRGAISAPARYSVPRLLSDMAQLYEGLTSGRVQPSVQLSR